MVSNDPIFILGIGRCGSTIFYDVLSEQENIAWLSDICSKYPNKPIYNKYLLELVDYPILKKIIRRRYQPSECYRLWDNLAKGFSTPFRDLTAEDVTPISKNNIINALSTIPTKNRNQLIIKLTGWSRIGYLQKIFPNAKFIHIIRDGRAVVNSILNVDFWWGWRGPLNWRWGELEENYKQEWEKYNKSFIALAAIEWKLIMKSFEKSKSLVNPANYLEIKYEDFCENTKRVLKDTCEFANINYSEKFNNIISNYSIRNSNTKWQKELYPEQQNLLNEILKDDLLKFNY